MVEIFMNGTKINWKTVKECYGSNYANELKEEVKSVEPYTTIINEDGSLELYVY